MPTALPRPGSSPDFLQSSEDSAAVKRRAEMLADPAATFKRGRHKWHYRHRNSILERATDHPLPDEELSKILTFIHYYN